MSTRPAAKEPATSYRRDPAQKRAALLAAARALFAERGFDAVSTQQIARRAGVSEGILFHHFGSKRGLFECVAEQFVEESLAVALPAAETLTEERVVRGVFDFADANPGLYRLLAEMSATGDDDYTARAGPILAAIRSRLEPAMAAGTIRAGDPEIIAQLQLAVVDGAYRAWRRSAAPARREAYIAEAARCMRGMLAPLGSVTSPGGPSHE